MYIYRTRIKNVDLAISNYKVAKLEFWPLWLSILRIVLRLFVKSRCAIKGVRFLGITVKKGGAVSMLGPCTLNNPTQCLAWEPYRRSTYSLFRLPFRLHISVPSHIFRWNIVDLNEKKKEIWLSPMTKPLYQQKIRKPMYNTKTSSKTSITKWLQTDLGRSVGVTTFTQLVWFNRFTGTQPSH